MLIPKLIILTSLFQGAIRPLIQAIIMDHCRIEDRKASYSLTYLGINLGAAVGFASAGLLFQKHPTWIFFISSIAVMGSLFVLMRWVPREGLHVTASHALEKAVSGNAFKAFLDRPLLVAFCFISLVMGFIYAQSNFGMTLYTAKLYGTKGASLWGIMMCLNAVVVIACTGFLTHLTQHLSGPTTMGLGATLFTLGYGMMAFRLSPGWLGVSTVIWTLGEVLWLTNLGAYAGHHTPVNFRGRFQTFRELFQAGGKTLSPWLCGAIITHHGIHLSWAFISLLSLICVGGYYGLHHWDAKLAKRLVEVNDETPHPQSAR